MAKLSIICVCGNKRDKYARKCRKCIDKGHLVRRGNWTIGRARTSRGPSIHQQTRLHAKTVMKFYDVPRICVICGYSKYVETCHIKSIKDFKLTAKLKEVNSLHNLVYLCPNHHKELDRSLLSYKEMRIINQGSIKYEKI